MREKYAMRWPERDVRLDERSPFGMTDSGHQDFRGIDFSTKKIENASIAAADFSYARLSGLRVETCVFEDCLFDHVDLSGSNFRNASFKKCRFDGTDLKDAALGIVTGLFEHCIFRRVRTKRALFYNPVFDGVEFQGKEWSHIDFSAAGLWNCAFVGELRDVMFRGDYLLSPTRELCGPPNRTGLHHVSLEEAELYDVGFTDQCALENIILPRTGTAFICRATDLIDVQSWSCAGLSAKQTRRFDGFFRIAQIRAQSQSIRIVSEHDIVAWVGDECGHGIYERLRDRIGL